MELVLHSYWNEHSISIGMEKHSLPILKKYAARRRDQLEIGLTSALVEVEVDIEDECRLSLSIRINHP